MLRVVHPRYLCDTDDLDPAFVTPLAAGETIPSVIDCVTARAPSGKVILAVLFGGAWDWPLPFIPLKAVSILGSIVGNPSPCIVSTATPDLVQRMGVAQ